MTDFSQWKDISSAIASDTLDRLGHHGALFARKIRPVLENPHLVGRARTLLFAPSSSAGDRDQMLADYISFIDSIKPGDVPVVACGPGDGYGVWGDVLSNACQQRGAAGCVTDGFSRDIHGIREIGFSLFCAGIGCEDVGGRGKIIGVDVPVECGGARVAPGDIIVGDFDGCVCVPPAHADAVLAAGQDALAKDQETLAAVRKGMLLRDVFNITGVF
jgi:4-hydroxy-4-methyl-2-oxoglutarate aldolase